jgi:hypothetical protein
MERQNSKELKSKFKHRSSDDRSRLGHKEREKWGFLIKL